MFGRNRYPELFSPGRTSTGFNNKVFWSWVLTGMRDSLAVFWFPAVALQTTAAADYWCVCVCVCVCACVHVCVYVCVCTCV